MSDKKSNSGAEAPEEQTVQNSGDEQPVPMSRPAYIKRTPGIWANPKKRRSLRK